jgi:hypothetical protein
VYVTAGDLSVVLPLRLLDAHALVGAQSWCGPPEAGADVYSVTRTARGLRTNHRLRIRTQPSTTAMCPTAPNPTHEQSALLAKVLYTEKDIRNKVHELGAAISKDYAGLNPIVACVLTGGKWRLWRPAATRRIGLGYTPRSASAYIRSRFRTTAPAFPTPGSAPSILFEMRATPEAH